MSVNVGGELEVEEETVPHKGSLETRGTLLLLT